LPSLCFAGVDIEVLFLEHPAVQRGFPGVSDSDNHRMLILQPGGQSLLELLRFKDWCLQNGLFLLGAAYSGLLASGQWLRLAAGLTVSSLCLAHGYALNQFYDELIDRLRNGASLRRWLLSITYLFWALALVLSCLISLATLAVVALMGITSWLHSSPPLSLKRHLFWRLFLNSFGFSLVFVAGASLNGRLTAADLLMGILIFLLYVPLELIHMLAHMEADRSKGIPTLPLIRGERTAIAWAMTILLGLILYSGMLWQMKLASLAFAGWSLLHLSLLMLFLARCWKGGPTPEKCAKLRLKVKTACAVYGTGLLTIFIAKI
jgi:4-hydroxybenzoate polyprenyltransferase